MAKKGGLGRGLSAILEDVEQAYSKEIANLNDSEIVEEINIDEILPNPYQPRTHFDEEALKELSASIKRHGLIQPIIVIKKDDGYMLIAGERRYRATKMLGASKIKAIIADIKSQNLRELALIENIQRENLNPIELAKSYKELINEYKITQDGLANIIHKSRTQITNTMRLLLLSDYTQKLFKSLKEITLKLGYENNIGPRIKAELINKNADGEVKFKRIVDLQQDKSSIDIQINSDEFAYIKNTVPFTVDINIVVPKGSASIKRNARVKIMPFVNAKIELDETINLK